MARMNKFHRLTPAVPVEFSDDKVAAAEPVAASNEAFRNREAWLNKAAEVLRPWLAERGYRVGAPYLSVGIPSSRKAIGQCWSGQRSADGRAHIFIRPDLSNEVQVLATLLHELLHEAVGCEHGHRKPFSTACRRVGLVKPWTATTPNATLTVFLAALVDRIGPYPHAALDLTRSAAKKKQATRMRKYTCPGCDQILRAATDTLRATCDACDLPFTLSETVKVGGDDDGGDE